MRVETRDAEYAEFVAARQTELRRLAYLLSGDWDVADDLVQAAFTEVYVAWPRLRREGTEEVVARRLVVRAPVGETRAPRWWRRPARPGTGTVTGTATAEHAERASVVESLRSLPAVQRKAVVLRHWLGLSVEETAEDLGISTRSVEHHTARALAALEGAPVREAP